jgi:dihydroxyacetone kinase-like protein
VKARIEGAGATIVMPLVGRYATSMEMAGVSFTLCKLDAELEALLKAPCDCAFWRVG